MDMAMIKVNSNNPGVVGALLRSLMAGVVFLAVLSAGSPAALAEDMEQAEQPVTKAAEQHERIFAAKKKKLAPDKADAARAQREALRDMRKAAAKQQRELRKAKRKAAREARKLQREQAKAQRKALKAQKKLQKEQQRLARKKARPLARNKRKSGGMLHETQVKRRSAPKLIRR